MIISGLPNASYEPGNAYTITISIIDVNGATGSNSFDFIVTAGTVSSSDPNVLIVSGNQEAHAGVYTVTSWTVVWTAPSSGSAQIDTWTVWGGGSRTSSPWNHDLRSLNQTGIPEFPTILIPAIGAVGAVVVLARVTKKRN